MVSQVAAGSRTGSAMQVNMLSAVHLLSLLFDIIIIIKR